MSTTENSANGNESEVPPLSNLDKNELNRCLILQADGSITHIDGSDPRERLKTMWSQCNAIRKERNADTVDQPIAVTVVSTGYLAGLLVDRLEVEKFRAMEANENTSPANPNT